MNRTQQELFDVMWKGLKSQNWQQSVSTITAHCVYRGDEGRKCALGWLIPDDKYRPAFDDPHKWVTEDVCKHIGLGDHVSFLRHAQRTHDGSESDMEQRFRDFAAHYNLTIPE